MRHFSNSIKSAVAAGLVLGSITPVVANAAPTAGAVACSSGQAGCVLPIEPAPAATPVAAEPVYEETGGMGWLLPALLAAAAVVGLILILDDDDDEDVISV